MSKDKTEYYREYHKRNYVPKVRFCDVCGKDLAGFRRKRCIGCRFESTCVDCGIKFSYTSKYKRCSKCQYKWYKANTPEKFEKTRERTLKKQSTKRRLKRGLPEDYVFRTGARPEGYKDKKGYVLMVFKDPITNKWVRKYQHVLVMSKHIGRELLKNETVHHKNGIRDDNRIENLELWSKAQPAGQRVEDKLKWCKEFISLYEKG